MQYLNDTIRKQLAHNMGAKGKAILTANSVHAIYGASTAPYTMYYIVIHGSKHTLYGCKGKRYTLLAQ